MKFNLKDIDKKWKEYALAGCVCILFFVCLTNLGKIWAATAKILGMLKSVFFGLIIAYVINPLAVVFQKKLFRRCRKEKQQWIFSVLLSLLIVVLIISLLMVLLIPQIVSNIASLAENYSLYVEHLKQFVENLGEPWSSLPIKKELLLLLSADGGLITRLGEFIAKNADIIIQKTTGFGAAAASWIIGGIFAIYFLLAKNGILREISKTFSLILSPAKYENARILLEKFNAIFSKYIVCELLDAFIIAASSYVFMTICGMPDAIFISFIVGITNLAPTFGPIVGMAAGGFILLLVKPAAILPFLIFSLILQTVDGYILKPKLFGDALNVPAVLILAAIVFFGNLMGVTGMLIAIPVAAILVYIYSQLLIPWLELRRDLKIYYKEQEKKQEE